MPLNRQFHLWYNIYLYIYMSLGRTLVRVKHYLYQKKRYLFCLKKVPKKIPFSIKTGPLGDLKIAPFWLKMRSQFTIIWKTPKNLSFFQKMKITETSFWRKKDIVLRSLKGPVLKKKGIILGTFFEQKRYLFF